MDYNSKKVTISSRAIQQKISVIAYTVVHQREII